jgi:peptidyl-prolyl cis-trans isomerase SurA
MKKVLFLFIFSAIVNAGTSQTLLTYGKFSVGKAEFLRAYNKNKTQVDNKEKAIREYVSLYSNFKIKVKAAQEMMLDTSEQMKADVESFRSQIEENYMNDDKIYQQLMNEAFVRSQLDLHVVRYTINVDEQADPADTLNKFQIIQNLFEQLKSNPNTAPDVPAEVKYTDMGFITAFSIPYAYESIVYKLNPGEVSMPYRSKKAWHIFKVIAKRKSAGKWKVAQILFTSPDNADENTKAKAASTADSVFQLLMKGADFASMARTYSDDKLTYLNGGEMPEFGTGKYDLAFENEVVKLSKDGEISAPFRTAFGIHILKRLSYLPTPTAITDDAIQFELKQKLAQDDRIKIAKDKFARDIKAKIGLKIVPTVKTADILRYADTVVLDMENPDVTANTPISNKIILTFAKGNAKGQEWLDFVREFKSNPEMYKGETNKEIWEKYISLVSLDYYKKHLEEYNADFKYQLQEFREGNLLFEIMEKEVWSKASKDTVGLERYYAANKQKYMWGESADVLILNCVTEALAKQTMDSLKLGKYWKDLVDVKQGELQGDSGRFEMSQIGGDAQAPVGSFSAITNNADGTATFIYYYKHYSNGDQRNFSDARGMVINDYQSIVEKNWLDALKKKYPVKVNEALLSQVIKESK